MNRERAQIKLQAIRDKDTLKIFQKKVWLPNIGVCTSEQQVKDWLKIRSDALEAALSAKDDTEINVKLDAALTVFNKDPDTVDAKTLSVIDFDKLCEIRLIKFALDEQPRPKEPVGEIIKK